MPVTASIMATIAAVGSTTYSAVSANQRSQDAKGQASKALADAPTAASDAIKANAAATAAAAKAKQKTQNAAGFQSTLLNRLLCV